MNQADFRSQAVRVFKALSDPTRYEMVRMLASHGEVSCRTFQETFKLSPSALSHHYRVLENAGLTSTRRDRQYLFHALDGDTLRRFVPEFERTHAAAAAAPDGPALPS